LLALRDIVICYTA